MSIQTMDNRSIAVGLPLRMPVADALGRHLQSCRHACGGSFLLRSWCEQAHEQLMPRFGTTVAVASLLIALIATLA